MSRKIVSLYIYLFFKNRKLKLERSGCNQSHTFGVNLRRYFNFLHFQQYANISANIFARGDGITRVKIKYIISGARIGIRPLSSEIH